MVPHLLGTFLWSIFLFWFVDKLKRMRLVLTTAPFDIYSYLLGRHLQHVRLKFSQVARLATLIICVLKTAAAYLHALPNGCISTGAAMFMLRYIII